MTRRTARRAETAGWLARRALVVLGCAVARLRARAAGRACRQSARAERSAGRASSSCADRHRPGRPRCGRRRLARRRVAVRERLALEPRRVPSAGRRSVRLAARAVGLFARELASSSRLLESYLHWRAGLGWHGLHCLVGPVHRDALPSSPRSRSSPSALVAARSSISSRGCDASSGAGSARPSAPPPPARACSPDEPLAMLRSRRDAAPRGPPALPRPCLRRPQPVARLPNERRHRHDRTHDHGGVRRACLSPAAALARRRRVGPRDMSPPVAQGEGLQLFTLAVPTEKEGADDDEDRADRAGRLRDRLLRAGARLEADGAVDGLGRGRGDPEGDLDRRQRRRRARTPSSGSSADPTRAKTYTFDVRQTYSDGSVVDWTGPESSDTPAPTVEATSSLGGGGSSTLAIVALVVGALGARSSASSRSSGGRRTLA